METTRGPSEFWHLDFRSRELVLSKIDNTQRGLYDSIIFDLNRILLRLNDANKYLS
jgi:hypothetical protein